jgi:hypothetical protein
VGRPRLDLRERFESRVEKTEGGCWLWRGAKRGTGYGGIGHQGKMVRAHRVAWELYLGAIPEGKWVLHAAHAVCGHRDCVNPEHLKLGDVRENTLDSIADGTWKQNNRTPRRPLQLMLRRKWSTYPAPIVAEIRAEYARGNGYKRIARKVGLTRDAVRGVVLRECGRKRA